MMQKLFPAGCLLALALLGSCGSDSSTAPSSSHQAAATVSQPLALTTSSAGLVEQPAAKGTMVRLEGHFESAVLARRNADGSITTECHDEQSQAEAFMQGAATTGGVK